MPVYDYKCPEHGIFNDLAAMDDYDKPGVCPHCSALSPRVIMLAPEVLDMSPARRQAFEKNEKARHEPHFSNNDSREENAERRAHAQKHGRRSCGCGHDHGHDERKSKLMYTADGSKHFPSMRPWMISH